MVDGGGKIINKRESHKERWKGTNEFFDEKPPVQRFTNAKV